MKFYHKLMREAAMWRRFWKRGPFPEPVDVHRQRMHDFMMSVYRQAQCWKWLWADECEEA